MACSSCSAKITLQHKYSMLARNNSLPWQSSQRTIDDREQEPFLCVATRFCYKAPDGFKGIVVFYTWRGPSWCPCSNSTYKQSSQSIVNQRIQELSLYMKLLDASSHICVIPFAVSYRTGSSTDFTGPFKNFNKKVLLKGFKTFLNVV